jgi:hypothetical protein
MAQSKCGFPNFQAADGSTVVTDRARRFDLG